MDTSSLLREFDRQIRRSLDGAESDRGVIREVSGNGGWSGVRWNDFSSGDASSVIAAQIERFAATGRPWEWKTYSYDRPADLAQRLLTAGFVGEPTESVLVAAIADLPVEIEPPAGVLLEAIRDDRALRELVAVYDQVFGGDHRQRGSTLRAAIAEDPPSAAAVLATADRLPIACGRVEFHAGTDFASLWGGATVPDWRRRGVFRAVVMHRAREAAARGFRYLQVDALPTSRPILLNLGFVELATTTPFTYPVRPSAAGAGTPAPSTPPSPAR